MDKPRTVLPIPDQPSWGLVTYDAKDPDTKFPPIEELQAARGRAQRPGDPPGRRGIRGSERFRRPVRHTGGREARRRRPQVHALPHHRPLRSDPQGVAHRPQPSLRRHGQHHRDRDRGAGPELAHLEHQGAARPHAQAQRLLHGAVRQVPRGARLADHPHGAVRHVALRRRRVRVLLRLHRRREQPVLPGPLRGHRPRSSRRRPPRKATTSPRTWPTTPSTGCVPRRRSCPTSRSSSTSRPAPPTRRTTSPRSGPTSTRASSPTAGTSSARSPSPGRRSSGSSPRTRS